MNIISRHLDYMVKNEIDVQEQHEQLPSSTGYLSSTRNLMVSGSLLLSINALQNSSHRYLLFVLKSYLPL